MFCSIETGHGKVDVNADVLDVVRMVASTAGYMVDIEPMEPGKFRITATREAGSIRVHGPTLYEAADELIGRMVTGGKHQ